MVVIHPIHTSWVTGRRTCSVMDYHSTIYWSLSIPISISSRGELSIHSRMNGRRERNHWRMNGSPRLGKHNRPSNPRSTPEGPLPLVNLILLLERRLVPPVSDSHHPGLKPNGNSGSLPNENWRNSSKRLKSEGSEFNLVGMIQTPSPFERKPPSFSEFRTF